MLNIAIIINYIQNKGYGDFSAQTSIEMLIITIIIMISSMVFAHTVFSIKYNNINKLNIIIFIYLYITHRLM